MNETKRFQNNKSIGITKNALEQGAREKFEDEVGFIDSRCKISCLLKNGIFLSHVITPSHEKETHKAARPAKRR